MKEPGYSPFTVILGAIGNVRATLVRNELFNVNLSTSEVDILLQNLDDVFDRICMLGKKEEPDGSGETEVPTSSVPRST